jgi:hypothetical protein
MKRKLALVLALASLGFLACQGDFVDNSTEPIDRIPVVQELPDHDATLSADVDMYISSTTHTAPWTYTLPHVTEYNEIEVSKLAEYCNPQDSIFFVGEHDQPLAEITNDGSSYHCRGWMRFATIGNKFAWYLVEFGGDVDW